MSNELAPEGSTQPGKAAPAKMAWCDRCGSLPSDEVRPVIVGMVRGDLIYSMPCSVHGCEGEVRLKGFELRMLQRGGLVADIPQDLKVIRDVQDHAMKIVQSEGEDAATPEQKVAAGKLALGAAKENLKMAGLLVDAPTILKQVNQQFNFDPGDVVDEELEDMFEGKDAFVIDVPVLPAPTKPTDVHPPVEEGGGGWL